jgi:chemotaxis protein MotB
MSMRNPRKDDSKEDPMRWLLTYADMITLLMLFFIILYALSSIDKEKYKEITQQIQSVMAGGNFTILVNSKPTGGWGLLDGVQPSAAKISPKKAGSGNSFLQAQIATTLQNPTMAGKTKMTTTEKGITVSVGSDFFFGTSSDRLSEDALPVVRGLAQVLSEIPNKISIEGYTDDSAVDRTQWDSNWDLSAARALVLLKALEQYGVPDSRLSVTAYGSTRSTMSNDTAEGRAYNRRVDVVIEYGP